ncbi:MAG: hypothetical protein WCH34_15665 [Bacteroidota bacterium]
MERKLKSSTVYKCDYISGNFKPDGEGNQSQIYNYIEYDIHGNILKEIHYGKEGEEESLNEFVYDANGHLIEQRHIEEGELAEKITYQTNAEGFLEKEFRHYLDDTFDTIEYTFDGEDCIMKKHINYDEEVEQTEYFEWNDHILVRECIKDADDEIIYEKKYSYDPESKLLLETHLRDTYEEKEIRTVNEYAESGNKSLTKVYDSKNRLLSRVTYVENENGDIVQLIEEEGYSKNTIYLAYDERGNIVTQEDYNKNEILVSKFEQHWDENNRIVEYSAFVDRLGEGVNQHYNLTYEYEFF